jgi:hypothetical protein
MQKTDLARSYALQHRAELESGSLSKKALARQMLHENPNTFSDVEDARCYLRYATGSYGTRGVAAYDFKSTIEHGLKSLACDAKPREDFILGPGRYGVVGDIHFGYQSTQAMVVAFDHLRDRGIENIVLNGDIIDCHSLSRWEKSPDARNFKGEVRIVREFLGWLRNNFGGWIGYKIGNHEHRITRYLMSQSPELYDLEELSFSNLFRLEEFDIDLVESAQVIKAGHLNIIHGHEFGESTFSPVNPARGLFLRAKCSILAGHNHQSSEHHENNINGDQMACWSIGCLCDLSPSYRPFAFTKWNHGFAVVEVEQGGSFTVENKRIIGDKVH